MDEARALKWEEIRKTVERFTAGPWTYWPDTREVHPAARPSGEMICGDVSTPANGALLAAAPQLLEAVHKLLQALEQNDNFSQRAFAVGYAHGVIARATGVYPS